MKKLFKLSIVAVVFLGLSTVASAQTNANVAVTATVNAALTLTPSDIALGTIQQASSTIDANANDAATEANLGVGASAGSLQIQGTTGASVDVAFANGILTDAGGANPATFTPSVYNGVTSVASGDDVTLTGGDITLDVGGTLAAPAGSGSYSTANGGTATPIVFTITYN